METKLIVLDMDGVLLGENVPTEEIYLELRRQKNLGVKTTVATGRPKPLVLPKLKLEHFSGPIIMENGGLITTCDGEVISAYPVPQKVKDFVMSILDHPEVGLVSFVPTNDQQFIYQYAPSLPTFFNQMHGYQITKTAKTPTEFCSWLEQLTCYKIIAILKTATGRLSLPCAVANEARAIASDEGIFANRYLYNLTADNVSKGQAVTLVAQQLNLSLKQVAVVGNDSNDLPMFQLPGVRKIAVNHERTLPPELRKLAHIVVAPHELPKALRLLNL